MFDGPSEFSRLLHYHIIGSARGNDTPTVEMIADRMGLKPVTVYKKLEGESPVSVEEFIRLYRSTGECLLEALKYIVRKCNSRYDLIDIEACRAVNGSFDDEKDDFTILLGRLTAHLKKSLEDGRIDIEEKAKARDLLLEIQSVVTRFLNEVENY